MKLARLIGVSLLASSLSFAAFAHNHKSKADIVDTAVAAAALLLW
ncbi:hypothetical protein ALON55S_05801 [Alishewanella longhuensis]